MPVPAIIRGSEHFFNVIYEGNGKGQRVGTFLPYTDNGTISKSCLFTDGDEPELSRTPSGAGNRDTFTLSFWIKRGNTGALQLIFQHGADVNNCTQLSFDSSDRIQYQQVDGGSNTDSLISNRTFEDTSKFYHFVLAVDTTQATEANRVRMYVDGDEITSWNTANYPSQNTDTDMNTTTEFSIGRQLGATTAYSPDCFLAEVNYVDGTQYTPSTFGITDTSTGRWIPKSLTGISYGTNGFRLQFANSAGQTIGDDTSGNGNDFTVTNLDANDIHLDTPTDLFPTLADFQASYGGNYDKGNLELDGSTHAQTSTGRSTLSFDVEDSTGYYFEFRNMGTASFGSNFNGYGITGVNADNIAPPSGYLYPNGGHYVTLQEDGNVRINTTGSLVSLGGSTLPKTGNTSTRDTIGCAVKSGKVWFSKNGIWGNANQGNPNSDGTPIASGLTGRFRACALCYDDGNSLQEVNFGQRLTLGGSATSDYSANNGGYFLYPPPSGFRAIKQDNLSTTEKGIPDFVWIKNRDQTDAHTIYDSTRGPTKEIGVGEVDETTDDDGLTKFLKGGFAIEDDVKVNSTGESYVAWNWIANGGTTAANTDGSGASIASVTQANQTAGFSIITHAGSGSNGTIAHGLNQAPEMVWTKIKKASVSGFTIACVHDLTGSGGFYQFLYLNENTESRSLSSVWNNTAPTNKVIHLGDTSVTNGSSENYLTFCWHSVDGYSKIGSYTGSGNANGIFVYTGFKPAWLLVKRTDSSGHWAITDTVRDPTNPTDKGLIPSTTDAEGTGYTVDHLSNGFKLRLSGTAYNANGGKYIYMAFAEHPFMGDGTNPATAR